MKNGSRIFRFVIVTLAVFVAWIFLAPLLAENLIVERDLARSDAIVVLGGSTTYAERTQKAAELYRQGVAEKILVTNDGGFAGWSNLEKRNPAFFELSTRELVGQNVSEAAIEIIKPEGDGTNYEAEIVADIAKKRGWKTVVIVTSAYHSRRAFWTFKKYFAAKNVEAELGIVSPIPGIQTPPVNSWWLSTDGWNFVAGEYVKSFYYWAFL